jgi:serralysin
LAGGDGNDVLDGGAGADILIGGAGADTFVFAKDMITPASLATSTDAIKDFSAAAGDMIDLSAIDAISSTSANEAFTWIGSQSFHKVAGELRFTTVSSGGLLQGDINGDGVADFAIKLILLTTLSVDHIVL